MKYLCGHEDDRAAVSNKGEPLAEADDYVDYICYACKAKKGPHYLGKLYIADDCGLLTHRE